MLTNTDGDAEGVAFSPLAAVGGSVIDDNIGPAITTYIGGTAGLYTSGSVIIESLLNYTATGTQITQNMGSNDGYTDKATTTSGTGGLLTGAGADSEVTGTPTLDSSVKAGTTVSTTANFVNLTLAYLNTDAEASSTAVGLIGGGEAEANAYSNGTLTSHIDGTVNAGTDTSNIFENLAVAYERANTHAVGWLVAIGAVDAQTQAVTSPTVTADMGAARP